jgi:hypothetical protein
MERARKCRKPPVFAREIYNMENAVKLSILGMVLVMSCAAAQSKPEGPWRIEVKTEGGIAGKGVGTYAVSSDGAVSVVSMAGMKCSYRATEEELQRIGPLVAAAHPETWKDSYAPEDRCCDRIQYTMTVDRAGVVKTTEWIDDPLPMPKDLRDLSAAMMGPAPSIRDSYSARCR